MKISYKKATPADKQSILAILANFKGDMSDFKLDRFVVAKLNHKFIGCVRTKVFSGGTLELASLAVLPEYQNRGIGGGLVQKILLHERQRPIFLLTSSDKENFYEKFGFSLIGPEQLPDDFKNEYLRITNSPFAKNISIIVMRI